MAGKWSSGGIQNTATVTTASGTTHKGHASKRLGYVVTACNGRTQQAGLGPAKPCARCFG